MVAIHPSYVRGVRVSCGNQQLRGRLHDDRPRLAFVRIDANRGQAVDLLVINDGIPFRTTVTRFSISVTSNGLPFVGRFARVLSGHNAAVQSSVSVTVRRLAIIFKNLNLIAPAETDSAVAVRTNAIFGVQLEIPVFLFSYEVNGAGDVRRYAVLYRPFDLAFRPERTPTRQILAIEQINRFTRLQLLASRDLNFGARTPVNDSLPGVPSTSRVPTNLPSKISP